MLIDTRKEARLRSRLARLIVKIAKVVLHEGDEPDAVADLGDSDTLSREGVTEVHFLSLETDPAAMRHGDRRVVEGIPSLA